MRIQDWRIVIVFLIFFGALESLFAGSTKSTPLLPLQDPDTYRDVQALSQTISNAPSIFSGAGAPGFSPQKIGDIYVSTTTAKIYISTSTATNASWAVVN